MDEHVLAAGVGLDESEALCCIEHLTVLSPTSSLLFDPERQPKSVWQCTARKPANPASTSPAAIGGFAGATAFRLPKSRWRASLVEPAFAHGHDWRPDRSSHRSTLEIIHLGGQSGHLIGEPSQISR